MCIQGLTCAEQLDLREEALPPARLGSEARANAWLGETFSVAVGAGVCFLDCTSACMCVSICICKATPEDYMQTYH